MSYDDLADSTAFAGDEQRKFRAYQLSDVRVLAYCGVDG